MWEFAVIVSLACVFQGVVGFGFALLAAPILLVYYDKTLVIPALSLISLVINLTLFFRIQQKINSGLVSRLILASVVGMPLGIWVLQAMDTTTLKNIVSIFSITAVSAILFLKMKLGKSPGYDLVAGFVSGALTTSVNMNGAPITLLLVGKKLPAKEFRKTVCIYFFCVSVISLLFFSSAKMVSPLAIKYAAVSVPGIIGAGLLGNRLAAWVPNKLHKIIALGTISIASVYALLT